jgi:glycosyltransferase involved in cell wall biosynthesis
MGPFLFRLFLRGRGARKLVSITQALADALEENFSMPPEMVLIAPDGVDLARYAELPPPPEARYKVNLPEHFTVGYTGHLYPGRGAMMILSMAQELPHVTFLVVGGEPRDVARIQEEASAMGLANVILTGFVSNQDLPLYQAACDVLLMPYQKRVSGSSGGDIARFLSPMKMFEYLASGRVILASDLPVLQEVLKANNSVILRSNDPGEWVKAIEELIADPPARAYLGTQARQAAAEHSWKKRAARILAGLEEQL